MAHRRTNSTADSVRIERNGSRSPSEEDGDEASSSCFTLSITSQQQLLPSAATGVNNYFSRIPPDNQVTAPGNIVHSLRKPADIKSEPRLSQQPHALIQESSVKPFGHNSESSSAASSVKLGFVSGSGPAPESHAFWRPSHALGPLKRPPHSKSTEALLIEVAPEPEPLAYDAHSVANTEQKGKGTIGTKCAGSADSEANQAQDSDKIPTYIAANPSGLSFSRSPWGVGNGVTFDSGLNSPPRMDSLKGIKYPLIYKKKRLLLENDELALQRGKPHYMYATGSQSEAMLRWQAATQSLIETQKLVKYLAILQDKTAFTGADRFYAAVQLETTLAQNPNRGLLLQSAEVSINKSNVGSLGDVLLNELFTTGARVFDMLTPAEMGHHHIWFTGLLSVFCTLIFAYMAAQYEHFQAFLAAGELQASSTDTTVKWVTLWSNIFPDGGPNRGPLHALQWVYKRDESHSFSANFLRQWGGRYEPDVYSGKHYQWVSSVFLHASTTHLASNILLFLAISSQVEGKYGTWRLVVLFLVSAIGGNLVSGAFENACLVYVGASGGVFGIFGLYIADLIVNFDTVKRPVLRTVAIMLFLGLFIYTVATETASVSHLSHVGGLICGIFPALLFLPRWSGRRKCQVLLPVLGGLVTIGVFAGCLVALYVFRLKHVSCSTDR